MSEIDINKLKRGDIVMVKHNDKWRTLEALGYKKEMDKHGFVCWRKHYRNSLEHDKFINMYEDGHITFNTFMELTKEDYEAIGNEMRKRGWWK